MVDLSRLPARLAAVCILACLGCSPGPTQTVQGGSDTEVVGITLIGRAQDRQGNPIPNAFVRLRADDYVPADNDQPFSAYANTVTDSLGAFVITGIDPGNYTIEVTDGDSLAACMRCDPTGDRDTVSIGAATLQRYATVRGTVAPPDGGGAILVRVPGLERGVTVDAVTGEFAVSDLPAGSYTVRIVPQSTDLGIVEIPADSLAPSSITDLPSVTLPVFDAEDYAAWPRSARIRINTSASGAAVAEDVFGFPLLVRLDASVPGLAFSANGNDLRFASSGGSPLRYQIDWWDASLRQAGIWVLVDTIHGNDSSQAIIMFWGKADAPSFSRGAAVFDSAAGFRGVWHLGSAMTFVDATPHQLRTYNRGSVPSQGALGGGVYLNGSALVEVEDAPSLEPPSLTLSCWLRRDGAQADFAKIIHKGKLDARPWSSYSLEFRAKDHEVGFQLAKTDSYSRNVVSPDSVRSGEWTHLGATFDQSTGTAELFVNGISQGTFVDTLPIEYYTDRPFPLYLGGPSSYAQRITGTLDEVRVESVPRNESWIRLCFENQRANGVLLSVEAP